MKPKTTTLLALLVSFQLAAFSQNNPLAKYIPENTNLVVSINPMRIYSKLPMESFRQSVIYRELMKHPDNPVNAIFKNPLETGVDFTNELLVYSYFDEK